MATQTSAVMEVTDQGRNPMPPHCDSLDGPVVSAARRALEAGDVRLVLPFVPEQAEAEVRDRFETTLAVRTLGGDARDVADQLLFETVVRLHRAGEGAPYTGLKPAGLSVGPVIPLAEQAVESGAPEPVTDFLAGVLRDEVKNRLQQVRILAAGKDRSVADGRQYVEAMLGFVVYCHHVFQALQAPAHEKPGSPHAIAPGHGGG